MIKCRTTTHQFVPSSNRRFKMKFLVALLAVVAVASAASLPDSCEGIPKYKTLLGAFQYIDCRLPWNEVAGIVAKYGNDAEVKKVSAFLNGPEFANVVRKVRNEPEIVAVAGILAQNGVNYADFVNRLFAVFNINIRIDATQYAGGFRGFMNELKELFALDEVSEIFQDLLSNNKEFRDFIVLVSQNEAAVERIRNYPETQYIAQELRNMGIDTDLIVELIRMIFGW